MYGMKLPAFHRLAGKGQEKHNHPASAMAVVLQGLSQDWQGLRHSHMKAE